MKNENQKQAVEGLSKRLVGSFITYCQKFNGRELESMLKSFNTEAKSFHYTPKQKQVALDKAAIVKTLLKR